MAEQFNPTRMELLKARGRTKLAVKGHKLLKQKRDALVLEFFKILRRATDLRGELNAKMKSAYSSLGLAVAYHGVLELEAAALAVKKVPGVTVEVKNVMGVKIPSIEPVPVRKGLLERGYGAIGSSAKLDRSAEEFEGALEMIIKLAESENALRKLIREIEKTKRRVNALEFVVIPRLHEAARSIALRLEDMERDSFVAMKVIKRKIGAKAAKSAS